MYKILFYILTVSLVLLTISPVVLAQEDDKNKDTFFLAKKKGLLGRLGKSISRNLTPEGPPQKHENTYLKFRGKIIRNIILEGLDFGHNLNDTGTAEKTFGIRIGNALHKQTSDKVISNNLYFKTGDKLFPNLIADNERYLRELVYIEDARILVDFVEGSTDSVDIVVLTKDNFSIGGDLVIESKTRGKLELRDENILGTGNRLLISGFHEDGREPSNAFAVEFMKRNIAGSFMDLTAGYKNYKSAFNSGRNEETTIYTRLEKPLVTPYIRSTGAVEWTYNKTNNAYVADSLYKIDYKYEYFNIDGWFGYSLDKKRALYSNRGVSIHKFVALRAFTQRFQNIPNKYKTLFDYRYTDFTGVLASVNVFRQSFYTTNFIYGFGRNEDIPEGFNFSLTAGYINKIEIKRPYAGLDVKFSSINKRGAYNNYTFSAGTYFYKTRFEDAEILFNLEHLSRLLKIGKRWYQRSFINTGIAAQTNPTLNSPLFLNSGYGLPYFHSDLVTGDLRASLKGETVFYNTKKVLGFRFAPFAFADLCLIKPSKTGLNKTEFFSAIGGGVRTRNENLVFGTIELKGYYFPRTVGTMKSWKIELNSSIRFKYKSSFIRRPDFIMPN